MSTLIKVTFSATSGEEVSGKAQIDRAQGIVTLPARFSISIDRARNAGERFEIVAHDNGYKYPLVHQDADRYALETASRRRDGFWHQAWRAITEPHKDQRQQYGRFAHTLSAAAMIGLAGYLKSMPAWSLHAAWELFCFFLCGAVLFVVGAVLSKGC